MNNEEKSIMQSDEPRQSPSDASSDHMHPHTPTPVQKNAHDDLAAPKGAVISKGYYTIPFDSCTALFQKLSILDRLLTPAILVCMVVGVVIGEFVPGMQQAFDTVKFYSVSVRKCICFTPHESY